MEYPSDEQVAAAMVESKRLGESEEELEARIEDLCRLSDEDLARLGVAPAAAAAGDVPDTGDAAGAQLPDPLAFDPAPRRARHDGWTAERQRAFIAALAETGCVSEACAEVGITARSAYRLREHADAAAFRLAWDHAQSIAVVRLTAVAWDRAIHGALECWYKDGELVGQRRRTSDRLLMWLLAHHDPVTYGWLSKPPRQAPDASFYPVQQARLHLPRLLEELADLSAALAEPLSPGDFDPLDDGRASRA